MRKQRLPKTDSIEALAKFWDTHDLADFEGDLKEAGETVFVRGRGTSLSFNLQPTDARRLKRIARSEGAKETSVLRRWIVERLEESSRSGRPPKRVLPPAAQKTHRG
jgi:hypothetical protein